MSWQLSTEFSLADWVAIAGYTLMPSIFGTRFCMPREANDVAQSSCVANADFTIDLLANKAVKQDQLRACRIRQHSLPNRPARAFYGSFSSYSVWRNFAWPLILVCGILYLVYQTCGACNCGVELRSSSEREGRYTSRLHDELNAS